MRIRGLRPALCTLLHRSGVLRLWRWWHRDEVTIVMVHGVMDSEDTPGWVPLRPQLPRRRLEACLRLLAPRYHFVSLAEAVAMITGRIPVRPYSLAFTFDDGYRNNLTHALPILRRWRAPGAFFLATGHVESRRPFWFDRLDFALQHARADGREVAVGGTVVRLAGGNRDALRAAYKSLRDTAKAIARDDRDMLSEMDALSETLEAESGRRLADVFETDPWASVLSWSDVRRAAAEPDVTFGSHTVDHIRLGLVDEPEIEAQLRRSKRAIEEQTGRPCRYFCYPNGSVSPTAAALTARCGYDAAVTTEAGLNPVGHDPMQLRRINLSDAGGEAETLVELSGLGAVLDNYVGRLRGRARPAAEE
jgi:peptidoglycan/xylan/chitin deacetylase (PgdA/CDA1 family)